MIYLLHLSHRRMTLWFLITTVSTLFFTAQALAASNDSSFYPSQSRISTYDRYAAPSLDISHGVPISREQRGFSIGNSSLSPEHFVPIIAAQIEALKRDILKRAYPAQYKQPLTIGGDLLQLEANGKISGSLNNMKGAINELESARKNGWILASRNQKAWDGFKIITTNGRPELIFGQLKAGSGEVHDFKKVTSLLREIERTIYEPGTPRLNDRAITIIRNLAPQLRNVDLKTIRTRTVIELPSDVINALIKKDPRAIGKLIETRRLQSSGLRSAQLTQLARNFVNGLKADALQSGAGAQRAQGVVGHELSTVGSQGSRGRTILEKLGAAASRTGGAFGKIAGPIGQGLSKVGNAVKPFLPVVAGVGGVLGVVFGGWQALTSGGQALAIARRRGIGALATTKEGRSAGLRTIAGTLFAASGALALAGLASSATGVGAIAGVPLGVIAGIAGLAGLAFEGVALLNDHWDSTIVKQLRGAAKLGVAVAVPPLGLWMYRKEIVEMARRVVVPAVKKGMQAAGKAVKQAAQKVVTGAKQIVKQVGESFKRASTAVVQTAKNATTVVQNTVSNIGKAITAPLAATVSKAASTASRAASSVAKAATSTVSKAATGAAKTVISTANKTASSLSKAVSTAAKAVTSTVGKAASTVSKAFTNVAKAATGGASKAVSTVSKAVSSAAKAVASTASKAVSAVSKAASSAAKAVTSAVSKAASAVSKTVSSAAKAVTSTVSKAVSSVSNAVSSIGKSVSSFFSRPAVASGRRR